MLKFSIVHLCILFIIACSAYKSNAEQTCPQGCAKCQYIPHGYFMNCTECINTNQYQYYVYKYTGRGEYSKRDITLNQLKLSIGCIVVVVVGGIVGTIWYLLRKNKENQREQSMKLTLANEEEYNNKKLEQDNTGGYPQRVKFYHQKQNIAYFRLLLQKHKLITNKIKENSQQIYTIQPYIKQRIQFYKSGYASVYDSNNHYLGTRHYIDRREKWRITDYGERKQFKLSDFDEVRQMEKQYFKEPHEILLTYFEYFGKIQFKPNFWSCSLGQNLSRSCYLCVKVENRNWTRPAIIEKEIEIQFDSQNYKVVEHERQIIYPSSENSNLKMNIKIEKSIPQLKENLSQYLKQYQLDAYKRGTIKLKLQNYLDANQSEYKISSFLSKKIECSMPYLFKQYQLQASNQKKTINYFTKNDKGKEIQLCQFKKSQCYIVKDRKPEGWFKKIWYKTEELKLVLKIRKCGVLYWFLSPFVTKKYEIPIHIEKNEESTGQMDITQRETEAFIPIKSQ